MDSNWFSLNALLALLNRRYNGRSTRFFTFRNQEDFIVLTSRITKNLFKLFKFIFQINPKKRMDFCTIFGNFQSTKDIFWHHKYYLSSNWQQHSVLPSSLCNWSALVSQINCLPINVIYKYFKTFVVKTLNYHQATSAQNFIPMHSTAWITNLYLHLQRLLT